MRKAVELTKTHRMLFEEIDRLRERIDEAEQRGLHEAAAALFSALQAILHCLNTNSPRGGQPRLNALEDALRS